MITKIHVHVDSFKHETFFFGGGGGGGGAYLTRYNTGLIHS